jgi:hypothetical protein
MGMDIKVNPKEIELQDVGWINRAKDRGQWLALVNVEMNF